MKADIPDRRTEHGEQVAIIRWRDSIGVRESPELALLFAIPNGGQRNPATAGRLRAEGVQAGVSDLFLPVARQGMHGLFIEMKRPSGGQLSEKQRAFQEEMRRQDYGAVVCAGADDAIATLRWYLEVKR